PGSRRADLYLEPSRVETGRTFAMVLRHDDDTVSELSFRGRRANPNLRMPGAALGARWLGQGPSDRTGPGPSVGPDGLQDARLALRGLSADVEVKSVLIEGPPGTRWRSGVNPEGDSNAELARDPKQPAQAELSFQPAGDLAGQHLKLTVAYANG